MSCRSEAQPRWEVQHEQRQDRSRHTSSRCSSSRFFWLDLGRYLGLEYLKVAPGGYRRLLSRQPGGGAHRVLRRLRRGHRAVPARRGDHDPRGRGGVRPALGDGPGLLRVDPRRHRRVHRLEIHPARGNSAAVRRPAEGDQRRYRARRGVLPVHAAAGAGVPRSSSSTW